MNPPTATEARTRISGYLQRRPLNPGRIGLKINLYRDYELAAVAEAAAASALDPDPIECFMVGDSYLMTHLGRATTRLEPNEHAWALRLMADLVVECRAARDVHYGAEEPPFLLADLPDGAVATPDKAVASSRRLMDAGADAVKIEVASEDELALVAAVAEAGIPTVVHIGYTPQRGSLRRYGGTAEEIANLCDAARTARDLGACALVLEMVTEAANAVLCAPHPDALPVYSIFSGRADLGGQSLNVWDSVFSSGRPSKYFPPTATLDPAVDRGRYREALVPAMTELLRLTVAGEFPLSPKGHAFPPELFDPWGTGADISVTDGLGG
jgi:ketopantoate hydroxymethyltransferase